jgi:small subunit ribosomal protein S4
MSRYIGPRLRIIRRIGKLRGFTRKKPTRRKCTNRGYLKGRVIPPGQHGLVKLMKTRPYDSSQADYLIRLKVKQRLRFNYGLSERQLVNYVRKAKKIKEATGQVLLQLLEMRFDNIVFRLNMAPTICAARQLINHGHIRINNAKVDIPSYMCKPKDVISVAMKKKSLKLVNKNLLDYYKRLRFYRKRLAKTVPFILQKLKLVSNIRVALQIIEQGKLKINNKKVETPKYICRPTDIITIETKKGIREIQLNQLNLNGFKNK